MNKIDLKNKDGSKYYNTVIPCPVCKKNNYFINDYNNDRDRNDIMQAMKIFGCEYCCDKIST